MKVVLGVDAIRYPLTGIGRYAYELALGLEGAAEVEELRFFAGARFLHSLPMPHLGASEQARADSLRTLRLSLLKNAWAVQLYRGLKTLRQRRVLHPIKGCVYHGPNYYLPPFDGPCVSTFHDLSMFAKAAYHPPERVAYMAKELPQALRRASVLITDCEYVRQEVVAYSGFKADRVVSVPLAASPDFRPRVAAECAEVLGRFGLAYQQYTFFSGTIEPRKNIAGLLDAYEKLPGVLRQRFPLVLTGYRGWNSEALHRRMQACEAQGWLRYLGYVPDADLPMVFAAARAFAFPSFYEGFGLPVLEAMASGVPVVCSDSSSLPEVSGGHALMCNAEDIDGLSALLVRALEDENWRKAASLKGHKHASTFSWRRVVNETLRAYELASRL